MNRTKTKLRNKLSTGRLEDLINITLNGEAFQTWQAEESFLYWKNINNLRNLV